MKRAFAFIAVVLAPIAGVWACSSFSGTSSVGADGSSDATAANDVGRSTLDATSDAGVTRMRRVFVTDSTFNSNEFGKEGGVGVFAEADSLCAQAAAQLDGGTFQAWISDGHMPAQGHVTLVGPYYDVTRTTQVFTSDLTYQGNALSELGLTPPASWWTGMATTTTIGDTCTGWTGVGAYGSSGNADQWYGTFDSGQEDPCMGGFAAALMCFEQ